MSQLLTSKTDQELVLLWNQQPELVFAELVSRYSKITYYQCRRILFNHEDANDAVQNTFIKAWRGFDSFKGDSEFSTWLFRIAYNESITLFNKRKKQITSLEIWNQSSHTNTDLDLTSAQIQEKLAQALALLPEKQRMVFHYRYYNELSFKQISEILNTSEGGLKANYHHAVQKIKDFLTH